jgi:HlyD family secretion protein
MRRLRRAIGLLLAAGGLLLAGCGPAPGDSPMSGYAEAELVFVAPSAAGLLETLAVQRGDRVGAGQLLYTLESDAQTLAREAAQARQERAEAQAQNLRKGRRPAELQAIDQQLAQARAAQAASQAALQRQQQLVAQGFVSAQRLDELVAARDRDTARVRELQAQRVLATEAARSDEVAAAAADARAGSAERALAAWREGQMQRTAPAEAQVYDVLYRIGEWVPAGAPVVSLLPAGALKLRFFVPEAMLAQAVVGRELAVSCDGCAPGLRARITFVSPQAEFTPPVIYSNDSRSKLVFMAEAEPASPSALKPGQPVDVRFAQAP